jgi:hypothetical protein
MRFAMIKEADNCHACPFAVTTRWAGHASLLEVRQWRWSLGLILAGRR